MSKNKSEMTVVNLQVMLKILKNCNFHQNLKFKSIILSMERTRFDIIENKIFRYVKLIVKFRRQRG